MSNPIHAMLTQQQKLTPKSGANLVGLDDFEAPGEQLYLIGHYSNEAAATAAQKQYVKKNPDVRTFIYGPQGDVAPKKEGITAQMTDLLSEIDP